VGPPSPSPYDLPAWTLVQAYHRVARRFAEVFAAAGLTAHQFGVLVQLNLQPGASQAALARAVLVTPQSMGPLLQQMTDVGLVRRSASALRGTATSVELTDHGREVLAATFPAVGAVNDPAELGLTAAEAVELNRLLHAVIDHLDGSDP
jgi:DNA-binding MarR family transcriptional regulator